MSVIVEKNGEIVVVEKKIEVIQNLGGGAWGEIGGDIANQTDLMTEFAKKLDKEPVVLPGGTDLDTVIENGIYYVPNDTINNPANSACMMIVNRHGTMQTGGYITQTVYGNGEVWERGTDEIELIGEYEWVKLATVNDLSAKQDKIPGKSLSTNDYTTAEQTKLAGIEDGAEKNVPTDWNGNTGYMPILNKPSTFPPSSHNHTHNDLGGLNSGDYQHLTAAEKTKLSSAVTSSTVASIVTLTQTAYDAIATKDPAALYVITGA